MNKKLIYFFFLIYLLNTACSFDNKTGIWTGTEREKRRISEIENEQKRVLHRVKIYSTENIYNKEISSKKKIDLTKPKKNNYWLMAGKNLQNSLGNMYLPEIQKIFLKKKIGKDKFLLSQNISSPLIFNNKIIISDDVGSIYNLNRNGKINWKKNVYKKLYKKVYKVLSLAIYENAIYITDNIGFIYKIDFNSGEIIWIKNHSIPLKSDIKIFENKLYVINQDNRLLCFNVKDGSLLWSFRSVSSFIKSQNLLSMAISKEKDLIILNSSGDLSNLRSDNGRPHWTLNAIGSLYAHDTDFFKSSKIVLADNEIIFSTTNNTFSFNIRNGIVNWENNIGTSNTPIVDTNNIFTVTDNGYFVNINRADGKVEWSTNILKILKKKKRDTKVTGFVLGSGRIYAVTKNGYLIIVSASSGKIDSFKKIGDGISSNPIIHDGSLYILTENSRILGLN